MLNESLLARNSRAFQIVARVTLCTLLSTLWVATVPPLAISVEPESLTTGIVPTMGINEVTEGTLLFKTNHSGRYLPAPILKTDVQIAVFSLAA
jgi:hypothetical protein